MFCIIEMVLKDYKIKSLNKSCNKFLFDFKKSCKFYFRFSPKFFEIC